MKSLQLVLTKLEITPQEANDPLIEIADGRDAFNNPVKFAVRWVECNHPQQIVQYLQQKWGIYDAAIFSRFNYESGRKGLVLNTSFISKLRPSLVPNVAWESDQQFTPPNFVHFNGFPISGVFHRPIGDANDQDVSSMKVAGIGGQRLMVFIENYMCESVDEHLKLQQWIVGPGDTNYSTSSKNHARHTLSIETFGDDSIFQHENEIAGSYGSGSHKSLKIMQSANLNEQGTIDHVCVRFAVYNYHVRVFWTDNLNDAIKHYNKLP